MNTPIITTHFEYHSIDQNLLKLDILGHDDPSMIRRMEDITGIDAQTIPMDDKGVDVYKRQIYGWNCDVCNDIDRCIDRIQRDFKDLSY